MIVVKFVLRMMLALLIFGAAIVGAAHFLGSRLTRTVEFTYLVYQDRGSSIQEVDAGRNLTATLARFPETTVTQVVWSADGEKLALIDGGTIYQMDANGRSLQQLIQMGFHHRSLAWSPDGRSLSFTAYTETGWTVFVLDTISGRIRNVSRNIENPAFSGWSPDGNRLAIAGTVPPYTYAFYLVAADGSDRRALVNNYRNFIYGLSWSPDGTQVVYTERTPGDASHDTLYVMYPDGSSQRQVASTFTLESNAFGLWSPDSARIVYASDETSSAGLYTVAVSGEEQPRRIFSGASLIPLAWSPDGRQIAFTSGVNGAFTLIHADGSSSRVFAHSDRYYYFQGWRP
jgi:Tol biopolymer transport system component